MLKDRVREVLTTINASNLELANHIGYSPSNISRLRSGKLSPAYDSSSINKFITGVIEYAELNGTSYELNRLIDGNTLLDYLYQDETKLNNASDIAPFSNFGEKLNSIMNLLNLNNKKLSTMINVDASMISRFRNGHRTPAKNPIITDILCQALVDEIVEYNHIDDISELIGINSNDSEDKDILYAHFRNWLCDLNLPDKLAVNSLIQTMNEFVPPDISFDPSIDISTIVAPSIINDTASYYIGLSGIRQAVIRFLATVILSDAKELYLYSDDDTDWMVEDNIFRRQWTILMGILIKKGVHISIIHNINRNVPEMIDAIKSWLPLYMSGMISAYYSKQNNGNRFAHTLFVCPGVACIESFHANSMDNQLYEYHTDLIHINYYMDIWNTLLASSETLIRIHNNEVYDLNKYNSSSSFEINNMHISLNNSSVIVTRTIPPYVSFIILHPLMHNAFRNYIEQITKTSDS